MPDGDDEDRSRFQRIRDMVVNGDDDSDDSGEEPDDESDNSPHFAISESTPFNVSAGDAGGNSLFGTARIGGDIDADEIAHELESVGGGTTYEIRRPDESHVIRSSPGGGFYAATKYGDLTEGRKIKNMEENTIEEWFFNEATNRFPRRRVGEAFVGDENDANGIDGIKRAVIDHAAGQIDDRTQLGEDDAQAFNEVADEWPREAQAMLCSEELNRDRHSGYQSDCRAFAEAHGVLSLNLGQTELDHFYAENPYEDPDLSEIEADIIMYLRVNDEDTENVLERIDDYESFINWYERIGSVDRAINAHEYDNTFDTNEMGQLAVPDEWPDDMDAGNVRTEMCLNCSRQHKEVFTDDHRRTWMLNGGEIVGGRTLGDRYLTSHDFICDSCFSAWEDNRAETVVVGEDTTVKVEGDRMLRRVADDDDWGDYARLTDNEKGLADSICRLSYPPDFSSISPDPSFGDSQAQEDALDTLMDPDTEFENGVAFIVEHDGGMIDGDHAVFLSRDNAALAQEVKQAIDSHLDYTATEQAA